MKLGLLRMSLDFRLRELPWDHTNATQLDALRQELLEGAGSTSPMYVRSRASIMPMAKCNQYLTVAKPAALTGTLQIRFVSSVAIKCLKITAVSPNVRKFHVHDDPLAVWSGIDSRSRRPKVRITRLESFAST